MIIYLITNLVNGKVYVGQTRQKLWKRWSGHKADAKADIQFPLYHAMRKYGIDSFEIKEIASCETQEWADYLEEVYILIHDSLVSGKGYNVRKGGNTSTPADSTREGARKWHTGRKHSDETKKLIGEAGRKAWAEGRQVGRPHTEQARHNMREAKNLKKNNRGDKNLHDELLVFLYNNRVTIEAMAEHFGVNRKTIIKHIRFTQLPVHKPEQKYIDEELLEKLYMEGVSVLEICRRVGCTFITVQKRVRALGLIRNQDRWQSFRNQSETPMSL